MASDLRDEIEALAGQYERDAEAFSRADRIAESFCVGSGGPIRAAMGTSAAAARDLRAILARSSPAPRAPPSAEGEAHAAAKGATPVSTYDGRTWLSTGSGAAPASGEAHAPEAPETCDACGADEPDPHKTDCPKTIGPYIGGRCSGCGWANNLWVRVRCRNCRAPLPDTKVPPAASPPSPKDADKAPTNSSNERK
jgi:hypothetical protein